MKETFAGTLKKLRKEKNLSQQQLADMLFVERSSIANWETGRRLPDAVLLIRIAGCLNIDVNFLLDAIDNTESRSYPDRQNDAERDRHRLYLSC